MSITNRITKKNKIGTNFINCMFEYSISNVRINNITNPLYNYKTLRNEHTNLKNKNYDKDLVEKIKISKDSVKPNCQHKCQNSGFSNFFSLLIIFIFGGATLGKIANRRNIHDLDYDF